MALELSNMKGNFLVIAVLFFGRVVFAGDLDKLPETQGAFKEKIEAFIKPGSKVKDAVGLLEAFRFKCDALKNHQNTTWCQRSDGGTLASVIRRYQVTLETEGALIKRVNTDTGLVGP